MCHHIYIQNLLNALSFYFFRMECDVDILNRQFRAFDNILNKSDIINIYIYNKNASLNLKYIIIKILTKNNIKKFVNFSMMRVVN